MGFIEITYHKKSPSLGKLNVDNHTFEILFFVELEKIIFFGAQVDRYLLIFRKIRFYQG